MDSDLLHLSLVPSTIKSPCLFSEPERAALGIKALPVAECGWVTMFFHPVAALLFCDLDSTWSVQRSLGRAASEQGALCRWRLPFLLWPPGDLSRAVKHLSSYTPGRTHEGGVRMCLAFDS